MRNKNANIAPEILCQALKIAPGTVAIGNAAKWVLAKPVAKPEFCMLGFTADQQALMIALYLAQDSFGTACNVTGDGAIAVMMNRIAGFKLKPKNDEVVEAAVAEQE